MKKIVNLLILILLLWFNYNITAEAITRQDTSIKEYSEKSNRFNNPYIEQYNYENDNVLNSISRFESYSEDHIINPEVERKNIIDILNNYYYEDVKVYEVVNKFYNENDIFDKTISLEKQDKIDIMHKIKDIYFDISDENQKSLLLGYLMRYADSSEDTVASKFLAEVNIKRDTREIVYDYNGNAAGDWAYNNYSNYSEDFPQFTGEFGSNCTNFVSQAMATGGGMSMAGDWFCYKKNSTYLIPNNASELNYSWNLSDPSPWISVPEFTEFWSQSSRSDVYRLSGYTYTQQHESVYNYNIFKGDIVIFKKGLANWIELPTHAMIISRYDTVNKDFLLAGNSVERREHPLVKAVANYASITIHHIKSAPGEWVYTAPNWYWYENKVAVKSTWKYIQGRWYYLSNSGVMLNNWQFINNQWYFLNRSSGAMEIGWQFIDSQWYFLNKSSGAMETGWQFIDNQWYYLYPSSGIMAINTVVDGWQIDGNGVANPLRSLQDIEKGPIDNNIIKKE